MVLILVNAELMPFAKLLMPTVAANAIKATTKAYSMRSWPDSSLCRLSNVRTIMLFISVRSRFSIDALHDPFWDNPIVGGDNIPCFCPRSQYTSLKILVTYEGYLND